jgi:hypothetical protein
VDGTPDAICLLPAGDSPDFVDLFTRLINDAFKLLGARR